jgi:hypothetical protein
VSDVSWSAGDTCPACRIRRGPTRLLINGCNPQCGRSTGFSHKGPAPAHALGRLSLFLGHCGRGIRLRPFWFLLEGDAEKKVERHIALNHPGANLLKVGHHGSAKATTPELVSAVKPAFAVISVGSGNSFGLPRREILGRLADAGTRVYRTDLDGAVTFYLDGHSVTASVGARQ